MRIYFEFCGGPRDGEVVEGDTSTADPANRDIDEGTSLYWDTRYGTIGEVLTVMSRDWQEVYFDQLGWHASNRIAPPQHAYRVREVLIDGDAVWIVAAHVAALLAVQAEHIEWFWERFVIKNISEAFPAMNPVV